MKYRIHKHCRRADCNRWMASDQWHKQVHSDHCWQAVLAWVVARVERESLWHFPRPADGRAGYYEIRDSLPHVSITLPEGFAELIAQSQAIWPESVGFTHTDPAADAEFATPTCGNPAKNDGLVPIDPEYHLSEGEWLGLVDSQDSEIPYSAGEYGI